MKIGVPLLYRLNFTATFASAFHTFRPVFFCTFAPDLHPFQTGVTVRAVGDWNAAAGIAAHANHLINYR